MLLNSNAPEDSLSATFTREESAAFKRETVAEPMPLPASSFTNPWIFPSDCADAATEQKHSTKKPKRRSFMREPFKIPVKVFFHPDEKESIVMSVRLQL